MSLRLRIRPALVAAAVVLTLAPVGCGGGGDGARELTRDELLDPNSCSGCHPRHVAEWEGSMHAYASEDPVFLALNALGQEQTDGELGDFCVQCHAPMALREGATTDGLNLDEVDPKLKGVTCYFCHSVKDVAGTHNNPLVLADDGVLRAGIANPKKTGAHSAGYSELLDGESSESSAMCGACHDVTTPAGVALERTYAEFQESVFSKPFGAVSTTCASCHMFSEEAPAASINDAPLRRRHTHDFAGVDVALTDFPNKERQRMLVQRDLDAAILPRLCINPVGGGIGIDVILDNVNAGHYLPSGSAFDRRGWVKVEAWEGDARVYVSGDVPDGTPVTTVAESDPDLWQLRDFTFDENGEVAHFFWDVREVMSSLLSPSVTNDPTDPRYSHSSMRTFTVLGANPDRITAQVFIRPIGLDLLDELIAAGTLDEDLRDQIPTFALAGSRLEWTSEHGFGCVPR